MTARDQMTTRAAAPDTLHRFVEDLTALVAFPTEPGGVDAHSACLKHIAGLMAGHGFVARWIDLPQDCLLRLGESPQSGTLGTTAVVGDRVWDCVQTFRIALGPLSFEQFRRFLPGGESLQRLVDLVRNYVGDEFAWQIQLVLCKEAIPKSELGQAGQLGWTTWLASEDRTEDADDMVLEPMLCGA